MADAVVDEQVEVTVETPEAPRRARPARRRTRPRRPQAVPVTEDAQPARPKFTPPPPAMDEDFDTIEDLVRSGASPVLTQDELRKKLTRRKRTHNWRPRRRPPTNHNGYVSPGDLVSFVNTPPPRNVYRDENGKINEFKEGPLMDLDYEWPKSMPAIVARFHEPGVVDLIVKSAIREPGEEPRVATFDAPRVKYDPTGTKPGSWY